MAYWTGEIVLERHWNFNSEISMVKNTDDRTYHYEADETQIWKLNGPPIGIIQTGNITGNIFDAIWTVTGSGNDYEENLVSGEKWEKKWTLSGSNKSGQLPFSIEIRITTEDEKKWKVSGPSTRNGGTLEVIDQGEQRTSHWSMEGPPTMTIEVGAPIAVRLTGGRSGVVIGSSGFKDVPMLVHQLPLLDIPPDSDVSARSYIDPRGGSRKLLSPWKYKLTGSASFSWRFAEK
jgi:hypothetical protein